MHVLLLVSRWAALSAWAGSIKVAPAPTAVAPARRACITVLQHTGAPADAAAHDRCPQVLFEAQGRSGRQKAVDLEDIKFHQCVRLASFERDRTISFIPPDGAFDLM